MAKQKARFFCEFCGTEVKKNDRICTHCGRFFASVRCPKCNATGTAAQFGKGCPECGYAIPKSSTQLASVKNFSKKSRPSSQDSLPVWIYVVSFLSAILLIFSVIQNVS